MSKFTSFTVEFFNANEGTVLSTHTKTFDTPQECREYGLGQFEFWKSVTHYHSHDTFGNLRAIYLKDGFIIRLFPHL